jgi:hypothetical protein
VADLAIASDDGRPFDERAVLDNRAFADENFFADEGAAFALVAKFGFKIFRNVFLDFLERFPGELAAAEDGGVFGLREVKQVGWFEHGGKLGELFLEGKAKRRPNLIRNRNLNRMEKGL